MTSQLLGPQQSPIPWTFGDSGSYDVEENKKEPGPDAMTWSSEGIRHSVRDEPRVGLS